MTKRLLQIILAISLTSVAGVAAESSAVPNVRTVSMQRVSGYKVTGQYLDLSGCSFDGGEFDVTITECDSLVSIVFPERRMEI